MTILRPITSLTESSKLLFFSYDCKTNRFTYVNPAFESFFGRSSDNLDLAFLFEKVHYEDRQYVKEKLLDCLNGQVVHSLECRIVLHEKKYWFRIEPHLVRDDDNQLLVGHAEDISLYKEHDENLNRHNDKKNAILGIMSHDLAGPIGLITNITVLLNREVDPDNVKVKKFLSIIDRASRECLHLIRDFLDTEFLETAEIRLLKRRADVVQLVQRMIEEYAGMQVELNRSISFECNRKTIYADIDEAKLPQVINNLISNALKFTRADDRITISLDESDTTIYITVADTGIGIPKEYHATLFDKFSPARRRGLGGESSTGLGMHIIKTIIEWHGGTITFKSEEGQGTTFYIQLPK